MIYCENNVTRIEFDRIRFEKSLVMLILWIQNLDCTLIIIMQWNNDEILYRINK